ncbi:MAG: extracellular solute-binding protein [Oscillospiraceae bacterium]|nr:extracellular solute-binding protein [Oscillospiraceae bacterium]
MNKFKRLAACAMAIAMVFGMTACDEGGASSAGSTADSALNGPGSTSSTSMATTTDPDENADTDDEAKDLDTGTFTPDGKSGVVKYLGFYDITDDQKGKEQCMIFESDLYGGSIEWVSAPNDYAYYEKLATLIAADDSPDILTYEAMAFPYGVSKNMFEPLDEYLDINDPLWADMLPFIEDNVYNGKHYYFPHRVVTSFALNYNRKTIEDAGLDDPYDLYMEGTWTWDAWRQMMIDFCNLSEDNIGFYATDTIATAFCNTTGKAVIDYDNGTIVNNMNDPDITRGVEFLADLGRNGLLYAGQHGDWVSPQIWAPVSDKILFLGMEPEWTYIAATEEIQNPTGVDNDIFNTPSDFAFVPFPRDPQADAYYLNNGTFGYMVAKGAKNIKGAIDFIYCNRLFETDQNIIDQVRKDHVDPEIVTYTAGKYQGIQKWQITWDEKVYDLWREVCVSDKFEYVTDDLYGFGQDVKTNVCTTVYSSTFGGESWSQLSQQTIPLIDSVLDEYR